MTRTVTRTLIAEHVSAAFVGDGVRTSDLVATAARSKAPPAVLERLHALPEQTFPNIRALWAHLPEVPVE